MAPRYYAFGPRNKSKAVGRITHYIMPFAFGVDHDGRPDSEARARLDKALEIARGIYGYPVYIFLGAGMPECTMKYSVESLAASATAYLKEKGWPADRIITRALGYSTVVETCALANYLKCRVSSGDRVIIKVVSSWWHTPRVWAVCRILLGWSVRVHVSKTGHSGKALIYDMAREMLAFPRSILMAWWASGKSR